MIIVFIGCLRDIFIDIFIDIIIACLSDGCINWMFNKLVYLFNGCFLHSIEA
jgi:hypothetical protein